MAASDFERIEALRKQKGLSRAALCRAAGVPFSTYWRGKARVDAGRNKTWWPKTVRRLESALAERPVLSRPASDAAMRDLYRAYVVILANERGQEPEKVLASDPQQRATGSEEWVAASEIRALAVYCVSQFLNVSGARVGWAVGLTRQAVSQILRRVEDLRDDPATDALLKRVGQMVSGENAWL